MKHKVVSVSAFLFIIVITVMLLLILNNRSNIISAASHAPENTKEAVDDSYNINSLILSTTPIRTNRVLFITNTRENINALLSIVRSNLQRDGVIVTALHERDLKKTDTTGYNCIAIASVIYAGQLTRNVRTYVRHAKDVSNIVILAFGSEPTPEIFSSIVKKKNIDVISGASNATDKPAIAATITAAINAHINVARSHNETN